MYLLSRESAYILPYKLWLRLPPMGRCTRYNVMRHVWGFLRVTRFPPLIKLTVKIQLRYCFKVALKLVVLTVGDKNKCSIKLLVYIIRVVFLFMIFFLHLIFCCITVIYIYTCIIIASHFVLFSSPCQRRCELLPSLGVRRLSSVNFSHLNLLLWNPSAKWSES